MPYVLENSDVPEDSNLDRGRIAAAHSTSDDHESEPADSLMSESSSDKKEQTAAVDSTIGVRRRDSVSAIQQYLVDIFLIVPSICFITYGMMALKNNGRPIHEDPVPALRMAATYSPTIFPIAFAAVAANLLKAAAGWKMERGVTVLSLEYLLSCRTVFSAVTTPLSLRRTNLLAPFLVALWAMSPLGGQAALRIMDMIPSQASELYPFEYLEFMSIFTHSSPTSSAGNSVMPSIQGTFISALSSPEDVKAGPRDAFGNVKIPMLEHYPQTTTMDLEGWYHVSTNGSGTIWSAIMGIPVATKGGFSQGYNYSFTLNTSYMAADCSVRREQSMSLVDWYDYKRTKRFHNGRNLLISPPGVRNIFSNTSMALILESYYNLNQTVANATCVLTTAYAEVDVACQESVCGARRIRRIEKPENMTVRTVLDGIAPEGYRHQGIAGVLDAFIGTFINITQTPWEAQGIAMYKPFPSALETYFTYPSAPFSAPSIGSWDGTDIYQVGNAVFSQRLSQLLNTFWLSSVASRNITGDFNFQSSSSYAKVIVQNTTGTRTPNQLVMRVSGLWMSILFIASTVMLASGIAASIFGCLRRGPDVLDRATFFLRDNPHVDLGQHNSMEDGISQLKRTKSLRICIGDIRPTEETGYVGFGRVGKAMPLSLQKKERRYA
ncbi:uncharacterized protein CTRU02_215162 [Colletotrichum truncatum]|uniref:Uncharacterized protein n=1 Tax=Colletotrichum truncatum TaxID=5467 RepID=A0ACC3YDQ1_COLTU|nr:uncharacterized protein CTRU02_14217 [Colletotrichum truncatum]KAF6782440.1 hypothetical protein CTRU02_14217 [Colletotrichum truncatum]